MQINYIKLYKSKYKNRLYNNRYNKSITYDGTLLKKCAVPLSSLKTQIYLEIEIENNKTQKFRTNINIDIPYQDDEKSIYDGNLIVKKRSEQ